MNSSGLPLGMNARRVHWNLGGNSKTIRVWSKVCLIVQIPCRGWRGGFLSYFGYIFWAFNLGGCQLYGGWTGRIDYPAGGSRWWRVALWRFIRLMLAVSLATVVIGVVFFVHRGYFFDCYHRCFRVILIDGIIGSEQRRYAFFCVAIFTLVIFTLLFIFVFSLVAPIVAIISSTRLLSIYFVDIARLCI